ncbi:hypothetical protein C4546_03165 [Candidatus Parcubacteria bacterium]|jgi:hypothetical protein|nr:MAG: hypothetical protein C4546_03165 [Candidatus Parcubacteria bacterium]
MRDFFRLNHKSKGYIALLSLIILGAVGSAVAVSVLLLGLNSTRNSLTLNQGEQAKAYANACAEEALQAIRDNPNFSGTVNLVIGSGTCNYTVVNAGGQNRTITTMGSLGVVVRKISIFINQISPTISISFWQEVAN